MREDFDADKWSWSYSRLQSTQGQLHKAGNYWPLAEPDTRAAPDAIKAAMLIGTYGHSNCHRVLSVVSCWWMRG